MFVQDDVVYKCGFLFFLKKKSGVDTGLQHALLLLRATIGPLCLNKEEVKKPK